MNISLILETWDKANVSVISFENSDILPIYMITRMFFYLFLYFIIVI